ncbi:leucine-zipper of insertion element IS481 [Saccharopolyspora shandongensis]|uniref:Leucine-zipper of insertion element IS481 n=1 Tax=Saccharopolyspora shandongensis TaxID=418495 RepID=A0A1H3TS94_9PSEU|nr:IS481 family transposase [Saccharopolyspora shandongensis]SDZ53036.1 leucine-zipper of insertion element IS481 [Saccharopolyspora shandongensis]
MAGHRNAPLTPEGRRRLCARVDAGRPIAHVAAEANISRRCLAKWYARWQQHGEAGLTDQSSRPDRSPQATPDDVADLIEALRKQTKHGPVRLADALARHHGITVAPATVHRVLVRRGLNRLRDLDPPTGEKMRAVVRYEHDRAGDMVHVDVKKLGRIPTGGGWRMHGIGTDAARASKRAGPGTGRVGYLYLHSAIDDHSRLAYTEALDDEKADTAAGFWLRAVAFFVEHGITPIHRVLTDNGSCYRSRAWAAAVHTTGTKHKRTRPYTPRTNGKVERWHGTLAREWAYVRDYTSENERLEALADFLNFYNHQRPHSALGGQPPITRTRGSDYRITVDQPPKPADDYPVQLTLDDDLV